MNPLPTEIVSQLDPDALRSIADALLAFPSFVRARGEDYALAERVHDERLEGGELAARVRGSRTYAVRWRFGRGAAEPLCTCPAGPICKHAYAVGVRMLGAAQAAGVVLDPRQLTLLPAVWRRRERPELPSSLVRPRISAPAVRAPMPPADILLRTFRDSADASLRVDVGCSYLSKHGLAAAMVDLTSGNVAHEADPEVRLWRLARSIEQHLPGRVPDDLKPYLDRPELEVRDPERNRNVLVERLSHWVGDPPREPRHLRVVLGLETGSDDLARVTMQVRMTNAKGRDELRSSQHLNQLLHELRREPRLLSPPQARLLRLVTDPGFDGMFAPQALAPRLSNAQLNLLLDRAAGSPFITWADDLPAVLAEAGGVKAGTRVKLDGEDLRLTLEAHTDHDELRLGLAFAAADGTTRPAEGVLAWQPERHETLAQPSVALVDGEFHRIVEEPPSDIVRMLAEMHGVPLRQEDGALLDRLASRFPAVAGALRELTHTFEARPVIAMDLRESDWLQMRVFAIAGDPEWVPGETPVPGAALFEYSSPGGWRRMHDTADVASAEPLLTVEPADPLEDEPAEPEAMPEEPAEANGTPAVWREVPAPTRVAPAVGWLERVVPAPGAARGRSRTTVEADAGTGWWLRLSDRSLEPLIDAWLERPTDVAWFGNRAARRLFAGERTVRARVSVVATGLDWLSVKAEWASEGLALTEADLAALRSSRSRFVRLAGGWVRREEAEAHDALAEAFADLGLEPGEEAQRLTHWQLAQVRPESLEKLAEAGADADTRAAVAAVRQRIASFAGIPRVELPKSFVGELRAYQQDGLDFLAWTSTLSLGAVLADDMGLGKTVQALAWLQWLRDRDPNAGPALVVCPASVVHNWVREAARFTPELRVCAFTSGRDRHARMDEAFSHDIVVTNYALLRRDIARWRERPLRALILDEAQNVKNPDAAVTRAAMDLNAVHRLALTGTPLENRALDLWSILSIVSPGLLGTRSRFVARYDRPDAPPHARRVLAARLRPVLLRRLKDQVARDLPPRIEEQIDCVMTPGQRKLYLAELTRGRALVETIAGDPGGMSRQKIAILALLTRLRQICCHPALTGGRRELGSGKFDALFELLEPLLEEGHKVLVFSQFVECLKLLQEDMTRRDMPHYVLTGSTPTRDREGIIEAFSQDKRASVFLVSLKAGGTGLNLTAASYVVLFDPWWNPAVEAQAIDRTHRIGQTRTVIAYRMLTEGTLEERIAELQRRKADLVRDILGEDGFARALTRDDLDYLLAE